jgi:uncharacterized protein (TIGR03905 family)
MYTYKTSGTCARTIDFDISEEGIITDVVFNGGCSGNQQGISSLVRGKPATEIISLLKGIECGKRPTSCPDQLARALEEALAQD